MNKGNDFFARFTVLTAALLLIVNIVLGSILTNQSAEVLKSQIQARMLDVSNSAAALLNGDELERLTAEDVDTEEYQRALSVLRAFQENVDLSYIYGIRDMGDGTFTFTIDPEMEDPGEFGEEIEYTDALYKASIGIAGVDEIVTEDRWGRFYSAYSPVFDSQGQIAGIVGVDFDAEWYENEIRRHRNTVFIISVLSLSIGAFIVFLITGRIRKRFVELNTEVKNLTGDMKELSRELQRASGRHMKDVEDGHGDADKKNSLDGDAHHVDSDNMDSHDVVGDLNDMVRDLREEMRKYIKDAHELAYTDTLTNIGNRTAYFDKVDQINRQMQKETAGLSVAVLDINGLKKVNDENGHEQGDILIIDAADSISAVFGADHVYRIGGDEFVVVLEEIAMDSVNEMFAALDQRIMELNRTREIPLAISKGAAAYQKDEDKEFNDIFRRADKEMYTDKANYYATHGDRRRR